MSKLNYCNDVFYEPRLYYGQFRMNGLGANAVLQSDPNCFRNGEQFPVRITHWLVYLRNTGIQLDERLLQVYGLKLISGDTGYINTVFHTPIPLWHNTPNAAPLAISKGNSTWVFEKPFTLSNRDTVDIKLQLESTPASSPSGGRLVSVALDGIGCFSKMPYKFAATVLLATTDIVTLDPDRFRNDGAEPVEVHSMSIVCGANLGSSSDAGFAGDIQELLISCRQVGNGTNSRWDKGPEIPVPGVANLFMCPAGLFGVTTGRAIVHKLPGDGWIFEPGEGVAAEVFGGPNATAVQSHIVVGAAGYIMAT